MIQTAEEHAFSDHSRQSGPILSLEEVNAYLKQLTEQGRTAETIKTYRHNLLRFLRWLPKDRQIDRDTLARWWDDLLEHGYQPRTINLRLSAVNSFLGFLSLREYQLPVQLKPIDGIQPELTRQEYLRLLSAARTLGKERVYFLVKVFAVTGISLHHLPDLTAEAVREGRIVLKDGRTRRIVPIPPCLRQELLDYLRRADILAGPVFVTRSGMILNRTAVTGSIQQLARDARVPPEKCNPRCLRKLCQTTREGVEQSVSLLVEQTLDRLLEQEQLTIGWEEVNGHG